MERNTRANYKYHQMVTFNLRNAGIGNRSMACTYEIRFTIARQQRSCNEATETTVMLLVLIRI